MPDLGLQAQNSADELAPHCFQLADNAYEDMVKTHKDQCFVVSGESGAGKTETVKITVGHIMTLCRAGQLALETKITKLNMILEPFGTCIACTFMRMHDPLRWHRALRWRYATRRPSRGCCYGDHGRSFLYGQHRGGGDLLPHPPRLSGVCTSRV